MWDKDKLEFAAIDADILEQSYYDKNYTLQTEYEMFAPVLVEPGEVTILKINQEFTTASESAVKTDKKAGKASSNSSKVAEAAFIGQETGLQVEGFTNEGEVLMLYTNKAQSISQPFAFGLKYYKPHVQVTPKDAAGNDVPRDKRDPSLDLQSHPGEGAYTFIPELEKDGYSYKYSYSQLDPNIVYQQGQNLDQYTLYFNNVTKK